MRDESDGFLVLLFSLIDVTVRLGIHKYFLARTHITGRVHL